MKFGIIGAMDCEIDALKKRIQGIKTSKTANLVFFEGTLEGKDVVLVKSGIGKVNAALCAQSLILRYGATRIINTGVAGAMDKQLKILDTVISTDCVYHDVDTTFFGDAPCTLPDMPTAFTADSEMLRLAMNFSSENAKFKFYEGRIASGDQFICDNEKKAQIEQNCHPSCVEMEGAAIAHACYLHKVPFLIIRSISDNANENAISDYSFNKEVAAEISANLVCDIVKNIL